MSIAEILYRTGSLHPDREAVIDGERRVTYGELLAMSYDLARVLRERGFGRGKHAAIMLPRSTAYVVSYFAILWCGGVVAPLGPELRPAEVYRDLVYCDVDLVITDECGSQVIDAALRVSPQSPGLHTVVIGDSAAAAAREPAHHGRTDHRLQSGEATVEQPVSCDDRELALLLHTSGTTSRPKRVMLSHGNVISNLQANIASLQLTADDVVLIALPMHFGYCNTAQMLTHLALGGRLVLLPGQFHPVKFFALTQRERVTTFTAVPTMLLLIADYGDPVAYDLRSLRYICFGGGPVRLDRLTELIQRFPHSGFVHTYGQTEASPRVTALMPEDSLTKIGSVGKPIPSVQVSLLDDHGQPVQPGEVGELVVNGANVMLGYYKRPDETQAVLRPEGLWTGDLARMDDDGYLYLVGRRRNMIISGGINIYPEEVEECLLNHPAIREVVVVGEEHSLLGEVPIALVAPHDEGTVTADEIVRFCAAHLAGFKVPRRVEFRRELAKTYNAKIRRDGQSHRVSSGTQ